jgi:peptidyl-prolyl cis-trans isomerase C
MLALVLMGLQCARGKETTQPAQTKDDLPEVVARVNGRPIPRHLLRLLAESRIKEQPALAEQKAQVYRAALGDVIEREVLFQEALSRGIAADEKQVTRDYDEHRVQYRDEYSWRQFLYNQGFTPQTYRKELGVRSAIQVMLTLENASIPPEAVSEMEARAFYDENPKQFEGGPRLHASHILVAVAENTPAEQKAALRKKAEALRARLVKGEDFAKVAQASSDDTLTKAQGGRMPEFGRGDMPKAFEEAVFRLKVNEISPIVESADGFHIAKLYERIENARRPYGQVRAQLRAMLLEHKRAQHMKRFIDGLKAKAKIETYI